MKKCHQGVQSPGRQRGALQPARRPAECGGELPQRAVLPHLPPHRPRRTGARCQCQPARPRRSGKDVGTNEIETRSAHTLFTLTIRKMKRLTFILLWIAAVCHARSWQSVALTRQVTHPQPMTGLVLWPDEARDRNATYGETIQLEFSYCLPCKVVTGCGDDGTIEYDWS